MATSANPSAPLAVNAARELAEPELQQLYRGSTFALPMTLAEMVQSGQFEAPSAKVKTRKTTRKKAAGRKKSEARAR